MKRWCPSFPPHPQPALSAVLARAFRQLDEHGAERGDLDAVEHGREAAAERVEMRRQARPRHLEVAPELVHEVV